MERDRERERGRLLCLVAFFFVRTERKNVSGFKFSNSIRFSPVNIHFIEFLYFLFIAQLLV